MDYTAFLTPTIGATGILALVVIMVLRGALVPKRYLDELREDKNNQIATWQETCTKLRQTIDTKDQHISALLEASKTTTRVIEALPRATSANERGDHHALAEAEE
jgi:hypothetical protein